MISVIETIKQNRLKSNEELNITIVFNAIVKALKENGKLINKFSKLEFGSNIDVDSLSQIFISDKLNIYGNIDSPFINNYGRVSSNMVPYGIVGVQTDKIIKLENYLEIIKVCLETRNSIIIKPYKESQTLNAILIIINDILKQTTDFTEIVVSNQDLTALPVDLLIYIGDKSKFNSLSVSSEKLFLGVGQYELYIDEALDVNLIDYAKRNGVQLFYRQDDVYDLINKMGANYCTAIMSGNKSNIREFIKNINSSHILVNMSPLLVDSVNLYPEQLLKRKTTVIYE